MKVTHVWFEKIRFSVICVVHTAIKQSDPDHMGVMYCVNVTLCFIFSLTLYFNFSCCSIITNAAK